MCNGCNDFPAGCGSPLCLNGKEVVLIDFYNKIKGLSIQDKFKIMEITKEYPLFSQKYINIDEEWCNRIIAKFTEEELNKILA